MSEIRSSINRIRFSAMIVCMWISLPLAQSAELQWNFDQGSLGGWEETAQGSISIKLAKSSGGFWFFFRAERVQNQTITFLLKDVPAEYFGDDYSPCISYDLKHWFWIKDRSIVPASQNNGLVSLSFRHAFAKERAWIAYVPPYTNTMLDDFLATQTEHPHMHITSALNTPESDLPVPWIAIADPEIQNASKKTVLIVSRQNAFETASSYMCQGLISFLLSGDPVSAAIIRRCNVYIVPMLDRDSIAKGYTDHPLLNQTYRRWSNDWDERQYSFFEQRLLKTFLQSKIQSNPTLEYALCLHSQPWTGGNIRREHSAKELFERQDGFFIERMEKKYLPWYSNIDRTLLDFDFSHWIYQLHPNTITGSILADWVYRKPLAGKFSIIKNPSDLLDEGELLGYAIADMLGVPSSDPTPFFHAAETYRLSNSQKQTAHVRGIYRDLQNRPPRQIQIVVNDKPYDLKPIDPSNTNYQSGVFYNGFIPLEAGDNQHYFIVSNGSKTRRYPQEGMYPGPFLVFPQSKEN